jgi:hypothetical protein
MPGLHVNLTSTLRVLVGQFSWLRRFGVVLALLVCLSAVAPAGQAVAQPAEEPTTAPQSEDDPVEATLDYLIWLLAMLLADTSQQ